jgi:predicted transposase/invertase (TIGR01784 family)
MNQQEPRKMYLNPFTDYGFKRLFANPKHLGPLRDFITHALAPFGIGEIIEIELLDRTLEPDARDLRSGTVDVLCRIPRRPAVSPASFVETSTSGKDGLSLQGGEQIIVEMQLCEQRDFLKRATFYASGAYRSQLKRGMFFDKLRPVYMIAILDFCIFDHDNPVSWHLTCDLKTKMPTVNNIFMTTIELPKFTKTLSEVSSSPLDEWIYLMSHIREWDRFPDSLNRPVLTEAGEILWGGALTPEEQMVYEKAELDWQTGVLAKRDQAAKFAETLQIKTAEAKQEGLAEGEKKGLAEGEKKGLAEGEKKGRRDFAFKAARVLLTQGQTLADVAKLLELGEGELAAILSDHKQEK